MKQLSKDQKRFLCLNLVFLVGAPVYPLYCYWVFHFSTPFSHCFLKEWFGVYCPLCGGTRALYELLHFRLLSALRYNAYELQYGKYFLQEWCCLLNAFSAPQPVCIILLSSQCEETYHWLF